MIGNSRSKAAGDASRQTPPHEERQYRLWPDSSGLTFRATSGWRSPSPTSSASAETRSAQTLEATQISGDLRVHQLTDEQLVALRDWIEANYQVEGDLRREVAADIRRKVEIGSYQGRRHRSGLPVRGQRTRTNARSRKGARKPVAGKKKAK